MFTMYNSYFLGETMGNISYSERFWDLVET